MSTQFDDALARIANELQQAFRSLGTAQPEDQLKSPVQAILAAAAGGVGVEVQTHTEVKVADVGARPDIGVAVARLLCGFVELKAPGKGARPERLSGGDRVQWSKLQALPNLVYTDGCEWALYRSGQRVGDVVRLGELTDRGAAALADGAADRLRTLLADFLGWSPIVPGSPRALAEMLAPLCRLLRDATLAALADDNGALSQLASDWRRILFPDADDAQFADAYAQTLTYAMLLARFGGERDMRLASTALVEQHHEVLGRALQVLGDPTARAAIDVPVSLLERAIAAVDPTALRQTQADPWLYFYEDFLAAYDPKLRNNRGVYYTPVEVVEAQVRLVAELLESRFSKPLNFVDDDVVVLDPGLGTGTYLLAALRHGLDAVAERFGPGALPARATQAARNLHGFEILVGPYAVARLRVAQQVREAGGELPSDGARIFLTDTLQSPFDESERQLPGLLYRPLIEEHRRARAVKANTRVLACIGNPPYDRQQRDPDDVAHELKGGWVRFGDSGSGDGVGILEDFLRPAREAGAGVHIKNLYNDYVYFWRWALWKVFERSPDAGIVSFITAASYLRGPGFVGMRRVMRQTFDELWIIDLEGDNLGARKTENVFAIQIPVAIAMGVRYGPPQPETPARVHYARLEGSREAKLQRLAGIGALADLDWQPTFADWDAPLLPEREGDWFGWPALTDVFPWQHSGVQFKRTWPIAETPDVLRKRWQAILGLADRRAALRESRDRVASGVYRSLFTKQPLPRLDALEEGALSEPIRPYAYRSFDRQWALFDGRLGDFLRDVLHDAHSPRQLYLTSLLTDVLGSGPAAVATNLIPDMHAFCNRGGKDIVPLFRDAAATQPNVPAGFLQALAAAHGGGPAPSAEDLFAYAYAILAGPGYVERFSEELTVPGPRLPIPADRALFAEGVQLGRRLVWLHTYGERWAPDGETAGRVPQGAARCTKAVPGDAAGYPERFAYDPGERVLVVGAGRFEPVPPEVYAYSVSGFQVVRSWLAYRMREGAGRRSSPLDAIRAERWPPAFTEELLQLLWVLEATIALFPALDDHLGRVLAGPIVPARALPTPTDAERAAPRATRADEARLPGL